MAAYIGCFHLVQQNEDGYQMRQVRKKPEDVHDGGA